MKLTDNFKKTNDETAQKLEKETAAENTDQELNVEDLEQVAGGAYFAHISRQQQIR